MDDKESLDEFKEKYAGSTYPVSPNASELPLLIKQEPKISLQQKRKFGRNLILEFYSKNKSH